MFNTYNCAWKKKNVLSRFFNMTTETTPAKRTLVPNEGMCVALQDEGNQFPGKQF